MYESCLHGLRRLWGHDPQLQQEMRGGLKHREWLQAHGWDLNEAVSYALRYAKPRPPVSTEDDEWIWIPSTGDLKQCQVCLQEGLEPDRGFTLPGCSHWVCSECLQRYCSTIAGGSDGATAEPPRPLFCPVQPHCTFVIDPLLKQICSSPMRTNATQEMVRQIHRSATTIAKLSTQHAICPEIGLCCPRPGRGTSRSCWSMKPTSKSRPAGAWHMIHPSCRKSRAAHFAWCVETLYLCPLRGKGLRAPPSPATVDMLCASTAGNAATTLHLAATSFHGTAARVVPSSRSSNARTAIR